MWSRVVDCGLESVADSTDQQRHASDTLHWQSEERRQRQKLALGRRLEATQRVLECLVLLPASTSVLSQLVS